MEKVNSDFFIGVDVGTQSVRAGLVTHDGKVIKTATRPIKTFNLKEEFYEQSSNNIWEMCITVIKLVTQGVDKSLIKGIGFDATCSLVALDENFEPVSLTVDEGFPDRNIILWMDHRAKEEANYITRTSHPALRFIGGKMSPEMQPAKLLWIKKNLPKQWKKVKHFFDLPDFLTWKSTGSLTRSLCSLVCKFLYRAEETSGWDATFWRAIGLDDLAEDLKKIGTLTACPGALCGFGMSAEAATVCNMAVNTPVSTSIIDCHAGAVGVLACSAKDCSVSLEHKLAIISGTSACHVKLHKTSLMTPGIWGPYFSAVLSQYHAIEAGQSAAGVLLDYIIETHPAAHEFKSLATDGRYVTEILNDEAILLASSLGLPSVSHLTAKLHVYPDFHGNRSPLADSEITGMVLGLTLSSNKEDLLRKYVATVQALAYSTRHIIESLQKTGHIIETLVFSGSLSKNKLYVQTHADVTGIPALIPFESESVLLGTAILAAAASDYYPDVASAMMSMCGSATVVVSQNINKEYHDKKFKAYLKLLQCQKEIREVMS